VLVETWIRSVPPAVAGGSVMSMRYCSQWLTHPLPQVVLTLSNSESDFKQVNRSAL
jgi:hypothetical protein